MNHRALLAAALVSTAGLASAAQAQLRLTSWNVTNFRTTDTTRDDDFKVAIYGVVPAGLPLAGRSMAPDVFVGQEFISVGAVVQFVNLLNTAPGSPGDWTAGGFIDGADTESAFFYRTSKITFLRTATIAIGSSSTSNQPRNTYRYDFRPIGYASPAASIGVYSVHLKAQGGTNSAGRRLIEAQRIRTNAEGTDTNGAGTRLPTGYQFMVAGDLNITTSSAPEYQEFVASQSNDMGRVFDPIKTPGNWNNNGAFRVVHTQEQTGNMDDRFDQILVSAGLIDGGALEYLGNANAAYQTASVPPFGTAPLDNTRWNDPNHSYRSWGNDGSTFQGALSTSQTSSNGVTVSRQNNMVGTAIGQALITSAEGNGHLPVLMDLRVPPKVQTVASIDFGSVAQGSLAQQTLTISNGADIAKWTIHGISALGYTLALPNGFITASPGTPPSPPSGGLYWPPTPAGSFYHYAGSAATAHIITMNTSTLGVRSGTIIISAPGATESPTVQVMVTGTVVSAANSPPTARAGGDQSLSDNDGNGAEPVTLNGSASTDSDGTITDYRWSDGPTTLAQSASPAAIVSLPTGVHTVILTVTDNNGATATDTVLIDINARPTANAGSDQVVTDTNSSSDELVTLDASASTDSDGTITTYEWFENGDLAATGVSPTVSLPVGLHVFTLVATDNDGAASSDTVSVLVNAPPAANAGLDQALTDTDNSGAESVTLDASASSDSDGTIVAYIWSQDTLQIASGVSPLVSLPVGVHTITLTVTDNRGATATDTVQITIVSPPPPTCPADFNADGELNPDDLADYIGCYFAEPACSGADFNADGQANPDDLADFIGAFFAGCP